MSRRLGLAALLAAAAACTGCGGGGVDAEYGRVRGRSVNGTGALAQMFRDRGHTVRVTNRLNDDVGEWSETLVRFAPYPGPPEKKEADWYRDWLSHDSARLLVYVPRDFDAEAEYWESVVARPPAGATARFKRDAERQRDETKAWDRDLPAPPKHVVAYLDWFAVGSGGKPPSACATLDGPWADGVDAKAAALTKHQVLKVRSDEEVLLKGDGQPLAVHWSPDTGGGILVIANGSFLLNEPLVNRARRTLANRVMDWAAEEPRNVAFVESWAPRENGQRKVASITWPFTVYPTGWVIAHWLAFLLLISLSSAAILGRPRGDPPAGEDRPVAHAEALGDLLSRSRDEATARGLLDAYRRWRQPSGPLGKARGPA